ncbi:hypothetical protein F5Y14DRAFT_93988 [Nemania sp. NC0429]|nr:hypothetical protein F5Y14DRAFT_93988 [Nemania sp. NC0429]
MDPFNSIPPELRLEVIISTGSQRSIWQLVQASPTMFRQYMAHKEYIHWKLLVTNADLDDDIIQDAMAIILFPPRFIDTRPNSWHPHSEHWRSSPHYEHWLSWSNRRFTNPLQIKQPLDRENLSLIKQIDKLHSRVLVFIEDYLTKATAACPSREYLCLPHSHAGGQLTFKDRVVCASLDVTQCNAAERRRFLKAFLRYEIICKFRYFSGDHSLRWRQELGKMSYQCLDESESEAVYCVEIYLDSLYRAVVAQCGDSDLPESSKAVCASQAPDFKDYSDSEPRPKVAIEHLWSSEELRRWERMSLNTDELCRWLTCFGFDLATAVVRLSTAGSRGRVIVGKWLQDLAKRGPNRGFNRTEFGMETISAIFGGPFTTFDARPYRGGPGLHQMLYTRAAAETAGIKDFRSRINFENKIYNLYRSRAWAFFDDARLFKSQGEGPHFPAADVIFPTLPFHDIIGSRYDYGQPWYWVRPDILIPENEISNLDTLFLRRCRN